ncbi:MAG: UDP-N-acetylmuramoyl-L-alanine--D-glutamate ligase [Deltaproteobacteria bacterium]|nr:UDP-N-acetylmuramoyl-L-alanine--D-glutamate ligase [Deltaproteobacteria bacterium]
MELRDRRVLVVGWGRSGRAAAGLLLSKGAKVSITDSKKADLLPDLLRFAEERGVQLWLGAPPEAAFQNIDLIVLSPGVPPLEEVHKARARGVLVWSEVELAFRFIKARLIGVTGSNGKSTVTTLIGQMLMRSGKPTFVGGNLGDPLCLSVNSEANTEEGVIVAELSSFQLEAIDSLRCHVALLLNLTENHLDRHHTFASYAAAKARIFHNQKAQDHALIPWGDPLIEAMARVGKGMVHFFGGVGGEVRVDGDEVVDCESGFRFGLGEVRLSGRHNHENVCAALLAARLLGASTDGMAQAIREFRPLPHRLHLVREVGGVRFYNDSKATNVGASVAAIESLKGLVQRVVLIAGGVDKGGSYAPLRAAMEQWGRALVLIGQAAPRIASAFAGSSVPFVFASGMGEAVSIARALAQPGDAVLLAPACSSFDMFPSYAARGEAFEQAVFSLE